MRRREFLAAGAALALAPALDEVRYAEVVPGTALVFPRDHGAHPAFRTEWWYVTGWLATAGGAPLGFQATFFRSRTPWKTGNPSEFTPRQILFAHAALADPGYGRLRHAERTARSALGLAGASETTTDAWIDDWRLALEGETYRVRIAASDFALELACTAHGPALLQGEGGYSRKGPRPGEASYYYSRPQLAVRGAIERGRGREAVTGTAWLDHEWSSHYLAPEAAGWDWCGINLEGGGALMAFRIRAKTGGVYYAGGTLAAANGRARKFGPNEIAFAPLRTWRSPSTGVEYPVAMRVSAGGQSWDLEPLMDDQELDARLGTGAIYWEGAARAMRVGRELGRGYLELTGYWRPLEM
ncbi:MAG TPA: lipocalin-like domain-containing protein [Burkholderiales bacterium]|nr:lipocalin-like domain-containing protein [Burkholderiales bacterium]